MPIQPSASPEAATALLPRIGTGEANAFNAVYVQYAQLIKGVACRFLRGGADVEDVLQEVVIQIWRQASSYNCDLGSLSGWIATIARNKAIDRTRAQGRRRRFDADNQNAAQPQHAEESESQGAWAIVDGEQRAQQVRHLLDGLPIDQRQAIELVFYAGMSQKEAADAMEMPLGTIKSHVRRGMLRMRDHLTGKAAVIGATSTVGV